MSGVKILHKIILIVGIVLFFLTVFSTMRFTTFASPGLTCQLKNGNCLGSETCVLSLNRSTNSHAGNCAYGNYKVCCSDPGYNLTATVRNGNCLSTEGEVIDLNKTSNSHAENPRTTYNYRVCLNSTFDNIRCVKRGNACNSGEAGLISLYQDTNSHAANYSDINYQIKICCNYTITQPTCGDGNIDLGETCDPPNTVDSHNCSQTAGYCNYTTRRYCTRDQYGNCNPVCQCMNDTGACGTTDDANYCSNCNHCGDGNVNCGEQCESSNTTGCNSPPHGTCDSKSCSAGCNCQYTLICDGSTCTAGSPDYNSYCAVGTCGNGIIEGIEQCDPGPPVNWGTCAPYEMCGLKDWKTALGDPADECKCYDLRPLTSGCNYYDYCNTTDTCIWWFNCYSTEGTLDPAYENLILKDCNDTDEVPHKFSTCPYGMS